MSYWQNQREQERENKWLIGKVALLAVGGYILLIMLSVL